MRNLKSFFSPLVRVLSVYLPLKPSSSFSYKYRDRTHEFGQMGFEVMLEMFMSYFSRFYDFFVIFCMPLKEKATKIIDF